MALETTVSSNCSISAAITDYLSDFDVLQISQCSQQFAVLFDWLTRDRRPFCFQVGLAEFLENRTLISFAKTSVGNKTLCKQELGERREIWVDSFCHDA